MQNKGWNNNPKIYIFCFSTKLTIESW
jgi:hypothetical protein